MNNFARLFNMRHRRVDYAGTISWYVNNKCVVKVTAHDYYGFGHIHPDNCDCNALVHSKEFQNKLKTLWSDVEVEI